MSREKFTIKWSPQYTTARALKGYPGQHPKVELARNKKHELVLDKDGNPKKVWRQDVEELVGWINAAIESLARSGYRSSTLRQLYYALVGKNLIPNHQTVYKTIGGIVTRAKYAGLISWSAIVDRGRGMRVAWFESSVASALEDTAGRYKLDRQEGQEQWVIVMAEKDAVSNIVAPVCNEYSVRYVINKGYASSSLMREVYNNFKYRIEDGELVRILYLGDHDPSGLDMLADVHGRLCHMLCTGQWVLLERREREMSQEQREMAQEYVFAAWVEELNDEYYFVRGFANMRDGKLEERTVYFEEYRDAVAAAWIFHHQLTLEHVALTMEQIQEYNLPPNPAKTTDSRSGPYIEQHGHDSWELDAIPHDTLASLVREAIERNINMEQYRAVLEEEKKQQAQIRSLVDELNTDEEEDE